MAPQFTTADLSVAEPLIHEGDSVNLSGQFTDPAPPGLLTVTVDWGDVQRTVLYGLFNEIASLAAPGEYSFSATHPYLTAGTFDIKVAVSDSTLSTTADASIVVNHVGPSIRIKSAASRAPGTIDLTSVVTHPGASETESVTWLLTDNGAVVQDGAGPDFSFAAPNPQDVMIAFATVTDSEGYSGSDSEQITRVTPSNADIVIPAPAAGVSGVIVQIDGSGDMVDSSHDDPAELDGYGGNETLIAGSGSDLLVGGPGANSLVAGSGDDTLISNRGNDTLVGGTGSDLFLINPGSDPLIIGSTGTYVLDFAIAQLGITLNLNLESGEPQVVDAAGDIVILRGTFNEIIGSNNGDNITANANADLIYAGAGNNTITGGSGNDSIVDSTGNDIIYLGSGNTTISGGHGKESIAGGSGNDIIYGGSAAPRSPAAAAAYRSIGRLRKRHHLRRQLGTRRSRAASGSDSLVGGSGNDIIYGGTGDTTISGGGGNATIVGGTGNDVIYGGSAFEHALRRQRQQLDRGRAQATTSSTAAMATTRSPGGSAASSIVGGSGNDIIYRRLWQ